MYVSVKKIKYLMQICVGIRFEGIELQEKTILFT